MKMSKLVSILLAAVSVLIVVASSARAADIEMSVQNKGGKVRVEVWNFARNFSAELYDWPRMMNDASWVEMGGGKNRQVTDVDGGTEISISRLGGMGHYEILVDLSKIDRERADYKLVLRQFQDATCNKQLKFHSSLWISKRGNVLWFSW